MNLTVLRRVLKTENSKVLLTLRLTDRCWGSQPCAGWTGPVVWGRLRSAQSWTSGNRPQSLRTLPRTRQWRDTADCPPNSVPPRAGALLPSRPPRGHTRTEWLWADPETAAGPPAPGWTEGSSRGCPSRTQMTRGSSTHRSSLEKPNKMMTSRLDTNESRKSRLGFWNGFARNRDLTYKISEIGLVDELQCSTQGLQWSDDEWVI